MNTKNAYVQFFNYITLILAMSFFTGCSEMDFGLTEVAQKARFATNGISINQDEKFTNQSEVSLNLTGDFKQEMYVTNDPTCETGGQWEDYLPNKKWRLAGNNKSTSVYVKYRFKNDEGASDCISDQIIHDDIAPAPSFVDRPDTLTKSQTANFKLTATDNLSGVEKFECQHNNKSNFKVCEPEAILENLSEGNKEFSFRVQDKAGNLSDPITYSWDIDLSAPIVRITQKPLSLVNSTEANFSFEATDNLSQSISYKCSINNQEFSSCVPSQKYKGLNEGTNIFKVIATDFVGNTSLPASYTWAIDLTAPDLSFTQVPGKITNKALSDFKIVSSLSNSEKITFQCQTNNGAFNDCLSQFSLNLSEGQQSIQARAVDSAGNKSQPISYSWLIDLTAPVIKLTNTPQEHTIFERTQIAFDTRDALSGLKNTTCSFNNQTLNCENKKTITLSHLKEGLQEFKITSFDQAGNSSVLTHKWQVVNPFESREENFEFGPSSEPADILFVVDNSSSMREEQSEMAERIDKFTDQITNVDWHIGITTTDDRDSKEFGDGQLIQFPHQEFVLNRSLEDSVAQDYLGQILQTGTNGRDREQGINATYRFIERQLAMTSDDPKKLLRDEAQYFHVVLLSDEDESKNDFRNKPENLLNFVEQTWGGSKDFVFHSIVYQEDSSECRGRNRRSEKEGKDYMELSRATGGIIGNICAENYSQQLKDIAKNIIGPDSVVTLSCAPVDVDMDGTVDLKVELSDGSSAPAFTITGSRVRFDGILPEGDHKFIYSCLK